MDLLTGNIRTIYLRYLSAAFGSAMISSIYGLVDTAMVGQYQGPDGAAALAIFAPIWNIIYSLGLLAGIGGSILFAAARGSRNDGTENRFFTAAVLLCAGLSALCWGLILLLPEPMLRLFGADDALLPLAMEYLRPVSFAVPVFLFNQLLSAFLRNDSRPGLTTAAVLAGGIFNVAGDYCFIFLLDMGIYGAGLATSLGAIIQLCILLSHFFSRHCTLRLVRSSGLPGLFGRIAAAGFSSFFIDVAMGILTMLFNRQIMRLLGSDALAVYGIIVNVSTIVQCCGYSVGQAAQPILSQNFGAGLYPRIRQLLRLAVTASICFGIAWTAAVWAAPLAFVKVFMAPSPEVLAIAPAILRAHALSFLLLPLNIFSTYFFQSVLRAELSFGIAVSRGALISGSLILLLPALLGPDAIWYAMPLTELLVFLAVAALLRRTVRSMEAAPAQ